MPNNLQFSDCVTKLHCFSKFIQNCRPRKNALVTLMITVALLHLHAASSAKGKKELAMNFDGKNKNVQVLWWKDPAQDECFHPTQIVVASGELITH